MWGDPWTPVLSYLHSYSSAMEAEISDRDAMIAELKRVVEPFLRSTGFKGSFPHYRKSTPTGIELLTFQFDRHGGAFVAEIARCPNDGLITAWGARVPPDKVKAWDVHPVNRKRIQPVSQSGTDGWFRYDRTPMVDVASAALRLLSDGDIWKDVPIGGSNQPYTE